MSEKAITNQLTDLLTKANAHVSFEDAVKNIPFEKVGLQPENLPYSIWMLVEHIRIAQADILDFSMNPNYKALSWPDDYWPKERAPEDEKAWQASLQQIQNERQQFISLVSKPGADLFSPLTHGEGQNLFREALLIADHTAYHTGEIILVRRLLNNWK